MNIPWLNFNLQPNVNVETTLIRNCCVSWLTTNPNSVSNIESIAATETDLERSQGRCKEFVAASQSNVFVRRSHLVVTQQTINVESALKQLWSLKFINFVPTLIYGWKKNSVDVYLLMLFQRWNETAFSSLNYCYHRSTLTLMLNQHWQYDIDSTLISRRPT